MSLNSLLTQPVTLVTRHQAAPDEFGDPTSTDVTYPTRGLLQVRRGTEDETDNARVDQGAVLYLMPWDSPHFPDAAEVGGVTWELAGDPIPFYNPRTRRLHHYRCDVRRHYPQGSP